MRLLPPAALLLLAAAAGAGDVPLSVTGVDLRREHAARRAALARALPPDSLAVCPADPGDPNALYEPRQDEDYAWLTGVEETRGVLLVASAPAGGGAHRELLLLPPRDEKQEGWVGPRLYPGKEAEAATGIAATGDVNRPVSAILPWLEGVKAVYLPRRGPSGDHAERLLGALLRDRRVEVRDLRPVTGGLRHVKSDEELARIRRACALSVEGHLRVMQRSRAGMPEYAVQAILEEACREGGCRRMAYDSIVGSGPNSCVLHYGRNRRVLEEGDLVLLDAGGEYLGYAADVTRTWPVGAAFSPEQAAAYDAVLEAQAAGEAAAKPGVGFKEIAEACKRVLEAKGLAHGIKHGPSHWVGLNVHDPNGDVPIRPGAVFTIEPGVYFPEKGWGIRIEDVYAMRGDGTLENLSAALPKTRAEVEALRAAAVAQ